MTEPTAPEPAPEAPDGLPGDLAGYVNFRDLGGHSTPNGGVRFERLFRSDSLAHAGAEHVEHLVEERGIRTVVDLRGAAEVDAYPNHAMRDAGATVHHVPLIDPERRAESTLDWEAMTLSGLYRFILDTSGARFVEALQLIAEPANHPLVFHCTVGKDRAGLVAATVLALLEVSDDDIVADYARTASALDALRARTQARAAAGDTAPADRFMTAEAETMRETLAWLRAERGGFEEYMLGNGLAPGEITVLRASMITGS
jgi:protein-tyrosine phosphatase